MKKGKGGLVSKEKGLERRRKVKILEPKIIKMV